MVKFSHLADCHLGGWRNPQIQELNLESFRKAIDISIKQKVNFVIIAGDLFDSAYPSIEVLKETFHIFSKLKEARIPCYLVAGSHDYSVSGKTFLDVLEKAGFCINLFKPEYKDDFIYLNPIIHENVALYGYPGRKSGLEVEDLKKVKLHESPLFKVFVLHTTLNCIKGDIPTESLNEDLLPYADYYALGHIHTDFQYDKIVYPGPLFPNNFQELADLQKGGFYIIDVDKKNKLERYDIKTKNVLLLELEIRDAFAATDRIIAEINKHNLKDKIVLLKLKGKIEKGRTSDIKFTQIEDEIIKRGAFAYLRNNNELKSEETTIEVETDKMEDIESQIIQNFTKENPSNFNSMIFPLINALNIIKQEDEKSATYEKRLFDEIKKIIPIK